MEEGEESEGHSFHVPLIFSALHRKLDTSSDQAARKSGVGQEPKKQRSTLTTPMSDSKRAKASFECDRLMGIGSVSSPSGGDANSEKTDEEEGAAVDESLADSVQTTWGLFGNLSGADEASHTLERAVFFSSRFWIVFYLRSGPFTYGQVFHLQLVFVA